MWYCLLCYSPILASTSWRVDSMTVGVVRNSTNMNSSVLIITALAHQLSWSTDKCSQMIFPATGASVTFQWSEKIFLDTDDSGLPCLTVLKSLRHLQSGPYAWKKWTIYMHQKWTVHMWTYSVCIKLRDSKRSVKCNEHPTHQYTCRWYVVVTLPLLYCIGVRVRDWLRVWLSNFKSAMFPEPSLLPVADQ